MSQNPQPVPPPQPSQSRYPAQPAQPTYPVPPVYAQQRENPADSVGSWMLAILITMIPVVGFVYLLIVAFGGTASVSRRNWARASFAWQIIGVVLSVLFIALLGISLGNSGGY